MSDDCTDCVNRDRRRCTLVVWLRIRLSLCKYSPDGASGSSLGRDRPEWTDSVRALSQRRTESTRSVLRGVGDKVRMRSLACARDEQSFVQLLSGGPLGAPADQQFDRVDLRHGAVATRRTKGCGSRTATLTMVWKLALEAEKTWRRLPGFKLIPLVMEGPEISASVVLHPPLP